MFHGKMTIYHIIKMNKVYLNSHVYAPYFNAPSASPGDEFNKVNIPKSLV